VTANLATDDGRRWCELAEKSDFLVESHQLGYRSIGLGYDALAKKNPRSSTVDHAVGDTGPQDTMADIISGRPAMMYLMGEEGSRRFR